MKSFLMVDLGESGESVTKTLYSNNATVLVIDAEKNLIKQALNEGIIEEAIILGAIDEITLKKVVCDDFDIAFVSVDDGIRASILITLQLKELRMKNIICKAVNHTQEEILYKIGATQVVFPEESMGGKAAYSVLRPTITDYLKFTEDCFIYEVKVPKTYVRKSLMELNLQYKYEINMLTVKHLDGKTDVTPDPNVKLNKDDLLTILSRENVIDRTIKI